MDAIRLRYGRYLVIAIALMIIAAVPVLAGVGASNAPGQQKEKKPSTPITISGTIETGTDDEGKKSYKLTDGGTTYTLEAGPKWFFDEGSYPLDKYVGQNVTIDGELGEDNKVDVVSVNGTALREPGKPPWAGGWKRVGERHPGWSQEKADRMKAKFGDCFPPGQCKAKPNKSPDANDD